MTEQTTTTEAPTLGAVLRDLRQARGLSLRALADQIGVTFPSLSHYERDDDKYAPSNRILDAYAALDSSSYTRDLLYHLAGKLPPEIVEWLLADPQHVVLVRRQAVP